MKIYNDDFTTNEDYELGYKAGRRAALRELDESSNEFDDDISSFGDIAIIVSAVKPVFAFHRAGDGHLISMSRKANRFFSKYLNNFLSGDPNILIQKLREFGWKGNKDNIYVFSAR